MEATVYNCSLLSFKFVCLRIKMISLLEHSNSHAPALYFYLFLFCILYLSGERLLWLYFLAFLQYVLALCDKIEVIAISNNRGRIIIGLQSWTVPQEKFWFFFIIIISTAFVFFNRQTSIFFFKKKINVVAGDWKNKFRVILKF